jgi:hypothetical protein
MREQGNLNALAVAAGGTGLEPALCLPSLKNTTVYMEKYPITY